MTQPTGLRRAALRCAPAALLLTACIAAPPEPVRIELVNETGRDLTPNFHRSASATTPEALFVPANLDISLIDRVFPEIPPGQTASGSFECDRLSAIGVRAPRAFEPATLTVIDSADELFLRLGDGFDCGQRVRFVYFMEGGALRVRVE